jgi:hypothetical protein
MTLLSLSYAGVSVNNVAHFPCCWLFRCIARLRECPTRGDVSSTYTITILNNMR